MNSSREATERLIFEQLVRETRDDLLAYAIRRTADAEDAADVLSETYLILGASSRRSRRATARGYGCSASPPTCCAAAPSATDRAKR
jgi:DNA-directed RNA polymerase specialized sigma24 family protein